MIMFWHIVNLEKFLDTLLITEKGEDKPCDKGRTLLSDSWAEVKVKCFMSNG